MSPASATTTVSSLLCMGTVGKHNSNPEPWLRSAHTAISSSSLAHLARSSATQGCNWFSWYKSQVMNYKVKKKPLWKIFRYQSYNENTWYQYISFNFFILLNYILTLYFFICVTFCLMKTVASHLRQCGNARFREK